MFSGRFRNLVRYVQASLMGVGSRNVKRSGIFVISIFLLVAFMQTFDLHNSIGLDLAVFPQTSDSDLKDDFYTNLFKAIGKNRPANPPTNYDNFRDFKNCKIKGNIGLGDYDRFPTWLNHDNLLHCYNLTEAELYSLQKAHTNFIKTMDEKVDLSKELIDSLFPNENGIVIIGGGRYSVVSIATVAAIREHGTTLPIEVIIPPQDEGDDDYCNVFLPKYDAKCVFFSDLLPKKFGKNLQLKSYQFKSLGLLASSFKNVLLVDSDNIPLKNLDHIFETAAFKKYGMILWPDIWRRVTSPVYYKIANIAVNLHKRVRNIQDDVTPVSKYEKVEGIEENTEYFKTKVPFHELENSIIDPSSETGQLLINKVSHLQTLMLAMYYNFYGPLWYFRMFSLNTAGEGDKETFISAAHAVGQPYYQVKTGVELDGYHTPNAGFKGIGLFQHDFEQDYQNFLRAKEIVQEDLESFSKFDENYSVKRDFEERFLKGENGQQLDVMFAHCGFTKFEPYQLYKEKAYIDDKEKQFRGFKKIDRTKLDIELFAYNVMKTTFCGENPMIFKYHRKHGTGEDWKKMCDYLQEHITFMESQPAKRTQIDLESLEYY